MEYRVILTQNNLLKKQFHKSNNKLSAFTIFRELRDKSDDVMFEKKHINNNGIIPVEYILYIVKAHIEGDNRRYIRNEVGKLVEEPLLFNQWTIMDSIEFKLEEDFWIYGYDQRKERKTIKDVISVLMKGMGRHKATKEIIVCHNKLLIYNEDEFDMVICKCIDDAQRLHHLLYRTAMAAKIKGLLFMGTATQATISQLYEIINEETGWPLSKIRRTTTRP